jgi:hypothetical protein
MSYYLHPFRVYITYPDEDLSFAESLKTLLELMGVSVYLAEHHKRPGKELWDKFAREIDGSDCIAVLYTSYAPRSEWIRKEIDMARTLKRTMIAISEENAVLPFELRGECKEYMKFLRTDPIRTLLDVGIGIWNLRKETPHAFFLTLGDRNNPVGDRLILIPKLGKAFVMGSVTDDLVRKGRIQATPLPWIGQSYGAQVNESTWATLLGFEYIRREPTLQELGLE